MYDPDEFLGERPKFNAFYRGRYGAIGICHPRFYISIGYTRYSDFLKCCCWKSQPEDEYKWKFDFGIKWCGLTVAIMKPELRKYYYKPRRKER